QAIQHQRRRPNAIFGNGLRKLGVERKIIPLRDGRGTYLFLSSPNISRTPRPIEENFAEQARLLERNFQNMLENRLPGERPDRHPAAGIWERTSPRFRRDRSRRDACPTLRLRPENNPVKGQARNLFIPDRNYCLTKYLAAPTADPGEFCGAGQTAGA